MTIQRSLCLCLLLAAAAPRVSRAVEVPLPPPPSGVTEPAPTRLRGYTATVLMGFLAQGDVASASLGVDVGRELKVERFKRAKLELHLPVRVARPSWTGVIMGVDSYGFPVELGTTDDTVWLLEAVPSARLGIPVAPGFSLHVQAGVGVAITFEKQIRDEAWQGHITERKLVLAPSIYGTLGLTYQLSDKLELLFQPLSVGKRAEADGTIFTALWGLTYRL